VIITSPQGVLLIKRKNPPYGWALPGGFVDYGETLEEAVVREAKEEVGLDIINVRQFHCYSDPARDPRQHTVTIVFSAEASGEMRASDDAADAKYFNWDKLPEDMAFDHRQILEDYRSNRWGSN
jgi:ADP-ribose pyrophosphatase YjhB (NUDIX family)